MLVERASCSSNEDSPLKVCGIHKRQVSLKNECLLNMEEMYRPSKRRGKKAKNCVITKMELMDDNENFKKNVGF